MTEIEGSQVIHEFTILHHGWEMDNTGWVTAAGKVYTTSHGGKPYQMEPGELDGHIRDTAASLKGLQTAREKSAGAAGTDGL